MRKTPRIAFTSDELPQPGTVLFDSTDAAYAEMMSVFTEVFKELQSEGIPLPSAKSFALDAAEVWRYWSRYAKG